MCKSFVLLACSPPSKFTVKFDVLFVFSFFSCLAPCLNSCVLFLKSCFSRANNMFFDHYCRIIMRNCTFCALCGYFILLGQTMICKTNMCIITYSKLWELVAIAATVNNQSCCLCFGFGLGLGCNLELNPVCV